METPSSTTTQRRSAYVIASLVSLLLLISPGVGAAVPMAAVPMAATAPTAPSPGDLDGLNKQLQSLEKKYGGDLALLRDTEAAAKDALARSAALRKDLQSARITVAQLAAAQYMKTTLDPTVNLLSADDPANTLASATMASHLAQSRALRVSQIQYLVAQQFRANKDATAKIASLRQGLKDLDGQRARLKALVDKFKPQSQVVGAGHLTLRMVSVRDEIDSRFGPFPMIGCYRPGDPQDHGTGHACDFMESTAGAMPTPDRQTHGQQVSDWAIANASRLGIKYIIYRQRIYDMRSPGWQPMSDRGGITANHFDHVHISVF